MQLGKYEILGELGRGGFGVVYKAHDTILDVIRAVKVLHPALVADTSFLLRFKQEARLAAQLEHPNLVPVVDFGEADGRFYLAMKYMPLGSLKDLLAREGKLEEQAAVNIFEQVCNGVAYAHEKGIIHRDLKPGNILFDESGKVRVSDLGFAKALSINSSLTLNASGGMVGTPAYMAPEIWHGKPANPASDQYSLACIFYEMLTGKVLFDGESPAEVMTRHVLGDVVELLDMEKGAISDKVKVILRRSLSRLPEDRFSSITEFFNALKTQINEDRRINKATSLGLDAGYSALKHDPGVDLAILHDRPAVAPSAQVETGFGTETTQSVRNSGFHKTNQASDEPVRKSGKEPGNKSSLQTWLVWLFGGATLILAIALMLLTQKGPTPTTIKHTEPAAAIVAAPTTHAPTKVTTTVKNTATKPPTATLPPPAAQLSDLRICNSGSDQEANKVLWHSGHGTILPTAFGSDHAWDLDGLYDNLDWMGFNQEITNLDNIEYAIDTYKGSITGLGSAEWQFEVPEGVEFLKFEQTPTFFITRENTRVWVERTFVSPDGSELDPQKIQDHFIDNDVSKEHRLTYSLISSPQSGSWKVTMTTRVEEGKTYTDETVISASVSSSLPVITDNTFCGVSLFILADPNSFFFDTELSLIQEYVRGGGNLLLIELPYVSGDPGDTASSVGELFGISTVFGVFGNRPSADEYRRNAEWPEEAVIEFIPLLEHPVSLGINRVSTFRPGGFFASEPEAELLFSPVDGVIETGETASPVVVREFGKGRVVAVANDDLVSFVNTPDLILEYTLDYSKYDNFQLAENIVNWLLYGSSGGSTNNN